MRYLFFGWNNLEQRIGAWASIIGLGLAIVALLGSFKLAETTKEFIYAFSFIFMSFGVLGTFGVATMRSGRKALCAEAMGSVREAVRRITTEAINEHHLVAERKRALACAMDDLSKAFSILTGSSCRCCVKHVDLQSGKFYAKTLCRSGGDQTEDKPHPIEHNTDFSNLFAYENYCWFFGNNLSILAASGDYQNTASGWPSRYSSTLVWPIQCSRPEKAGKSAILGFLCVDSRRKQPFSEEYDYPIGAIVADALGPFMLSLGDSLKDDSLQPNNSQGAVIATTAQSPPEAEARVPARSKAKPKGEP